MRFQYVFAQRTAAFLLGTLAAAILSLAAQQEPGVNKADERGRTPLHYAAEGGVVSEIRALIAKGANINAKTRNGQSVLSAAAGYGGHVECVQLLLDAGVERDPAALGMACIGGNRELIEVLLDAGITPDAGLYSAVQSTRIETLRLLLDRGANVNYPTETGYTPLHAAMSSISLPIVKLLLVKGADVNAVTNEGETPLYMAVSRNRNPEVIKLLVESGAKMNLADNLGVTPVQLAKKNGTKQVYDWLLAANDGNEPAPVLAKPLSFIDLSRPTSELLVDLESDNRKKRNAVQETLILRGKEIMPDVLKRIEAGTDTATFHELFAAMGPHAEGALPLLASELKSGDPTRVASAAMSIGAIRAEGLDNVEAATRQEAAATLYERVVDPKESVVRGIIYAPILVRLGDPAVPTILRLLRHDDREVRGVTAESLRAFPNPNEKLQAELMQMLDKGQDPYTRAIAAEALANPTFHSPAAKAALMESFRNPPKENPLGDNQDDHVPGYLWDIGVDDFQRFVPAVIASYGPEVFDECVGVLRRGPDSPDWKLYKQIWNHVGYGCVPRLRQLQDDQDKQMSELAYEKLGLMARESPEAMAALTERLEGPDKQRRLQAANALLNVAGRLKDALAAHFIEFIGDPGFDFWTRFSCTKTALSLASAQTKASESIQQFVPEIAEMAANGEQSEKLQAVELLSELGPAAAGALPKLRELAARPLPEIPKPFLSELRKIQEVQAGALRNATQIVPRGEDMAGNSVYDTGTRTNELLNVPRWGSGIALSSFPPATNRPPAFSLQENYESPMRDPAFRRAFPAYDDATWIRKKSLEAIKKIEANH